MSLSTVELTALLNEAYSLPKKITNDEDKGKYTDLINRIRDESKKLDAIRDKQNDEDENEETMSIIEVTPRRIVLQITSVSGARLAVGDTITFPESTRKWIAIWWDRIRLMRWNVPLFERVTATVSAVAAGNTLEIKK